MPNDQDSLLANLIKSARDGNDRAIDDLLKKYRPFLKLVAEQAIGPGIRRREDASDLVQQTQLDVYRAISEFRGSSEAEFTAWVRQILRRNVSNAVRDNRAAKRDIQREQALIQQDGSAMLSWFKPQANQASPSQQIIQSEQALHLAAALDSLPDDQREAVRLRHLEGCKLAEIAELMDRSPDAVAGLIRRGVSALKHQLSQSEADSLVT